MLLLLQLATIVLVGINDVGGVIVGGCLGHFICTGGAGIVGGCLGHFICTGGAGIVGGCL